LSENEQNEQIEEAPAVPESGEETTVEAEAPVEEPEAVEEPVADEPGAAAEAAEVEEPAAEEPAAEEPAAEEPAADEPVAEEPAAEEAAAEAEPAAEEQPAEEPASEESPAGAPAEKEAAAAPQPEPKKKRKRLPRRLRPPKARHRTPASVERKPIVRQPKPEHDRGRRQERRGVVVSSTMDKTIVVKVDVISSHQRYKKVIHRSVKFHAHDEQNTAKVGDIVRIVETRPLSKTKRWRLAEVVEAAK
jgi:ribosomal protein uS17